AIGQALAQLDPRDLDEARSWLTAVGAAREQIELISQNRLDASQGGELAAAGVKPTGIPPPRFSPDLIDQRLAGLPVRKLAQAEFRLANAVLGDRRAGEIMARFVGFSPRQWNLAADWVVAVRLARAWDYLDGDQAFDLDASQQRVLVYDLLHGPRRLAVLEVVVKLLTDA